MITILGLFTLGAAYGAEPQDAAAPYVGQRWVFPSAGGAAKLLEARWNVPIYVDAEWSVVEGEFTLEVPEKGLPKRAVRQLRNTFAERGYAVEPFGHGFLLTAGDGVLARSLAVDLTRIENSGDFYNIRASDGADDSKLDLAELLCRGLRHEGFGCSRQGRLWVDGPALEILLDGRETVPSWELLSLVTSADQSWSFSRTTNGHGEPGFHITAYDRRNPAPSLGTGDPMSRLLSGKLRREGELRPVAPERIVIRDYGPEYTPSEPVSDEDANRRELEHAQRMGTPGEDALDDE